MQFACGHLPSHQLTGFKFSHKGSFGAAVGKGVGAGVGGDVGSAVGSGVGSAVGSGAVEGVGGCIYGSIGSKVAVRNCSAQLHEEKMQQQIYLLERPSMSR
jgi:hypothetical protein